MGRYYDDSWPSYVPVAERRRKAAAKVARMKKAGSRNPVFLLTRDRFNTHHDHGFIHEIPQNE